MVNLPSDLPPVPEPQNPDDYRRPAGIVTAPAHVQAQADENDRLEKLLAAVTAPAAVPKIGQEASDSMSHIYETVAKDIELLGQEAVERAAALDDQCREFAEMIRHRGDIMRDAIRSEAAKHTGLMEVLKLARQTLASPAENVSRETQ